jgi:hypothetical protein
MFGHRVARSPLYCDVIVARYEQFTGQKAVLGGEARIAATGRSGSERQAGTSGVKVGRQIEATCRVPAFARRGRVFGVPVLLARGTPTLAHVASGGAEASKTPTRRD